MFLKKIIPERFVNKLLYLLSQKSAAFKCSIIILLLSLIFFVWLFLFIRPVNAALKFNKAKSKQLHNLKQICSQGYDDCAYLSKRVDHLSTKIDRKISIVGSSSAYRSLGKVIDCINRNGIRLIDYSPGNVEKVNTNFKENLSDNGEACFDKPDEIEAGSKKIDKSEFAKKVSFELKLEGTFLNMFNFFRCLSVIKYCLKYNQLYLNKNEQGLIGCKLVLDVLQVSK